MKVYKNKGLVYCNAILDMVASRLIDEDNLGVTVETFYNCREQGYVLRFHDKDYKKEICVWVYADRWGDSPTISWDFITMPKEEANMYDEETWSERTKSYNTCEEAMDKIVSLVEENILKESE